MDYFEVLERRGSVRSFKEKDIPEEDVRKLLSASMLAPSAGNLQAWEIVLVRDESRRKKIAAAALDQNFIAGAPVCLVVCANEMKSGSRYGFRGRLLYSIQDATIISAYIQLTATAMGLASVWVGAFDEDAVAGIVNAPEGMQPIALIPIGYAAEEPSRTPRRRYEDVVASEEFG